MTLYVPGGTENTIMDTYLRQFWSQSCGFTGCAQYRITAPPGWHADPTFQETIYCCGGHGGCANCIMALSQELANYPTEVTFLSNPPGAQIFIDGIEWWPGAVTAEDGATFRGISPGTHTYELRMTGYQSATGTFILESDTPITVPPPTGNVSFSSIPAGAEIFIDGTDQRIITPDMVTNMPHGDHIYLLKLSGYNDYSGTVSVVAGQTATVTGTLIPTCIPAWNCETPLNGYENDGCGNRMANPLCNPPQIGNISFASIPPGAEIYIDDADQNIKTPATISDIPVGTHTYTLKQAGYIDVTGTVDVESNQTAIASATLIPVSRPGIGLGTGTFLLLTAGALAAVALRSRQKTTLRRS